MYYLFSIFALRFLENYILTIGIQLIIICYAE